MAFTEFDGELDDEAGFQPFDGELDPPAPTAKAAPGLADRYRGQFEQAKKALGFGGIEGGRGKVNEQPGERAAYMRGQQPFRDKREAIDEAVNEIELGQPAPKVFEQFAKMGVTQDEIVARGTALGGKAFTPDTRPVTVREGALDGAMRANEPSMAEGVANFGARVAGRGRQMATGALAAAGVVPPESAAAALARSQKRIDAAMPGAEMQRGMEALGGAKTFGEAFGAIAENPAATGLIVAESAALFLPVLAAAVAVGLPAMGTAGLVGASSAAMEFGGALTETLAERNIDARDVVAVEQALNDPGFMADARKRGAIRGVTIGAFDALSAGLAGKFIAPVVREIRAGKLAPDAAMRQAAVAATKEIGLQAATGAGGEQAAQSMMGEFKPLDTVIEGLAGVATGPLEAASNIRGAGALARAAGREMSVEDALITALETGQTRPAPIRVEDMPTTPLTPEQVAAIQPQVEPIPTGEATELPGMPTDDGERIPVGQATELAGPRATTPADLGVASVPQGSLAAMAEQQLRGRFVQPELPADAPLAVPAADAGRDQPRGSINALGRMADDGGAGSVLPGEPVPARRGGEDQPTAAGDAPRGLNAAAPAIPAAGMSESQGNTKPPGAAAPRLQNRDRSDAAYIQQMQAIGKNPDPDRLGVDRNMATGAPIVLADAVPAAQLGRVDRVVTAAGRKFPVQYAVVEAADLLPSNSADGTANAGYADGLPGRARVVAGNGRAAGLQLAFTNGNAAGYVQGITADAGDHGVNPATLAAMKQPVLVRIMQPADVTANIGDESNVSGVADKSAREVARDDARRLDLATLDFNDDGTLTAAALDGFVNAMPTSEQTALRDSGGAPTKQAQDRLMAAVFQTAYEDDALLALYAQAIDPEARVVMAGLAAAAPQMMLLKDAGILDIRAVVSDAAQQAINAKRRGIKLADMAAQSDLDRDAGVSAVLGMFARNNRSAKKIGEELRAVAQFAYDEANKPAEDMFGPVPRAKRADVLERLNDARSPQSLEDARRGSPAESDVQGRPAAAAGPGNDGAVQADRPAQDAQAEDLAEAPTAEPFTTNGRALVYAAQNGIAGKVKPVEVTGGWALVPKERAPSAATAEADATALDKANTALAKAGWKTPAGKPWKLKPAKNVPPIFKTVAAIIDAAFGVRVQAVNGAPGNGLQFRRGAFVDTARVTSPEMLIGVTGHEVKHWFDANDKATGAKLDQAIEQHLKAGAVQAQMERENAQLVSGEAPMTEAGARLELLSDINGALWVDPDFWGRLYDIDSNAFRKVLYQFMRAATKFIKVAQGSTFDLTAYVDNVAAVRDAAAQAMVERAENRRGKAGPQTLVRNARRGRPSPLDQDLFAENAAAAPVAERPSPRDRDLGDGGVATTQAGGGTALQAPASTTTPAQADDFNLTAPTRGDVLAQQQARADETKAEAARRRARDEGERRDREQREIADRARQDASAENFVLGQDADEALAGQGGLFNSRAAGFQYKPAEDLSPADQAIEKRLGDKIAADFDAAVAEYSALPDTYGGRILNVDTARELSADYLIDRTKSAAVHEPASAFIKALYAKQLAEQEAPGQAPTVLFTAGGTGAGKTTAIQNLDAVRSLSDKAQIVYDTNMNGYASSKLKIEQALQAGKAVDIVLVARDPEDALVNGALPRAEGQRRRFGSGRTVPIRDHIATHIGAMESVKRLAKEYAGNPLVSVTVIDNGLGKGKAMQRDVAWLDGVEYNDVERRVTAALEREYEQGRITEATYRGFGGSAQAAAQTDPAATGDRAEVPRQPGRRLDEGSEQGRNAREVAPAGAEYARLADPFADNYARLEGRKVSFDVRIEDTGQTATFTVDAAQYLRELDQRRDVARRLADCVAR